MLGQRAVRLGEDAQEVVDPERGQLHPDRKATLKLGDEVRGLGGMEGAGGDEQDVVGAHRAVPGRDGAALDKRQQVALHPLARDVGAGMVAAARDLVDLVEEHDAVLLDVLDRPRLQIVLVDELARLLLGQQPERLANPQPAGPGLPSAQVLEHALELAGHLLHAGRGHDLDPDRGHAQLDLDLPLVELPLTQHLAELLPGGGGPVAPVRAVAAADGGDSGPRGAQQDVQDTLLRRVLGPATDLLRLALPAELHRDVGEVAHDGLDVAPRHTRPR